jgi:hypothetical protein
MTAARAGDERGVAEPVDDRADAPTGTEGIAAGVE